MKESPVAVVVSLAGGSGRNIFSPCYHPTHKGHEIPTHTAGTAAAATATGCACAYACVYPWKTRAVFTCPRLGGGIHCVLFEGCAGNLPSPPPPTCSFYFFFHHVCPSAEETRIVYNTQTHCGGGAAAVPSTAIARPAETMLGGPVLDNDNNWRATPCQFGVGIVRARFSCSCRPVVPVWLRDARTVCIRRTVPSVSACVFSPPVVVGDSPTRRSIDRSPVHRHETVTALAHVVSVNTTNK